MKWSDLIPADVVTALLSGDYVLLLRPGLGAAGSVLIETDNFLKDTVLTGDTSIEVLALQTRVICPVVENTMSGDVTLTDSDKTYQVLNPNGADRNLTLPTPATGMSFVIKHAGSANTITVKKHTGATLGTLSAGDFTTVIYSGSDWQVF